MANFFIIRNKEKNMYYWGDGSWTKSKDCAKKYQHKDCAEILMQIDRLDYKICEVIEIPSIADLEAKLAESEKRASKNFDDYMRCSKKYTELKQQLAEKEQAIESLQEINQSLGQTCNNDAKEIERLREQLAEKDVEIENLKNANSGLSELIGMKDKTFYAIEISEFQSKQNQTAIAELEKVKDWLELKYFDKEQINYLANAIDQQIKELKGDADGNTN